MMSDNAGSRETAAKSRLSPVQLLRYLTIVSELYGIMSLLNSLTA